MALLAVVIDGPAGGAPDAVRRLVRVQPAAAGGLAQRFVAPILRLERMQRHQPRGSGDVRDDEAAQVVDDRSGDELGQQARAVAVAAIQRGQVAQNVSHGCTNMAPADAEWMSNNSKMGDVVNFTGSSRAFKPTEGIGVWVYDFAGRKAQSALV